MSKYSWNSFCQAIWCWPPWFKFNTAKVKTQHKTPKQLLYQLLIKMCCMGDLVVFTRKIQERACHRISDTVPKTNIAPQNGWLGDDPFMLGFGPFSNIKNGCLTKHPSKKLFFRVPIYGFSGTNWLLVSGRVTPSPYHHDRPTPGNHTMPSVDKTSAKVFSTAFKGDDTPCPHGIFRKNLLKKGLNYIPYNMIHWSI